MNGSVLSVCARKCIKGGTPNSLFPFFLCIGTMFVGLRQFHNTYPRKSLDAKILNAHTRRTLIRLLLVLFVQDRNELDGLENFVYDCLETNVCDGLVLILMRFHASQTYT